MQRKAKVRDGRREDGRMKSQEKVREKWKSERLSDEWTGPLKKKGGGLKRGKEEREEICQKRKQLSTI